MKVSIKFQDDQLVRFGNQLGALGERGAHMALSRAINRVTDTVYNRTVRAVAKQSSIPAPYVARHIHKRLVRPGYGGALEGVVWGEGKPLSLKVFGAKQFQYGVRAKVWGRVQRFPGAFIYAGTYNSGKEVAHGHVFKRTTGGSLPIEKLFGPSIPEEMIRGESERQFFATVETMLPERVAHEIGRLLKGAN